MDENETDAYIGKEISTEALVGRNFYLYTGWRKVYNQPTELDLVDLDLDLDKEEEDEGEEYGDEIVKTVFRFAEQYAPDTELYYNEFNVWRPSKLEGVLHLVKMLQEEGIRIDGVGIQAHWGLNYPKNHYVEEAIEKIAALGVKVMITEIDVDVLPLTKEGQIIGQSMSEPQFQLEEFAPG